MIIAGFPLVCRSEQLFRWKRRLGCGRGGELQLRVRTSYVVQSPIDSIRTVSSLDQHGPSPSLPSIKASPSSNRPTQDLNGGDL